MEKDTMLELTIRPTRAVAFTRKSRLRPDGVWEHRERIRFAGADLTARLVDGRMTVFRDGEPAPDSPWQHVMDAQQAEADRVMVRYVDAEEVDRGDVWTWVLDRGPTGHRAPFAVGDLVMRARCRHGVHVVLGVEDDVDGMIRLRVKDTVPVVDREAF